LQNAATFQVPTTLPVLHAGSNKVQGRLGSATLRVTNWLKWGAAA
jgi:hypothetical protein